VLEEGGISWLPSHLWRLDRTWESMRAQFPHIERRPSEVVREQFWLTTQPVEEPDRPEQLVQVFDRIGPDRLLFATDYPHWDYDDPARAFPAPLPDRLRDRVYRANAVALYGLPEP